MTATDRDHLGTLRAIMSEWLRAIIGIRTLLSGLVRCGVCSGPYALRLKGRFACSNHVDTKSCSNGHSIDRKVLEARVLDGLRDKLMAPEIAAEAVKAYVEEANRLRREHRVGAEADKAALARIKLSMDGILDTIQEGRKTTALLDRLDALEAEQIELQARLAEAPADVPDIHPNIAEIYARRVARLADALGRPGESSEAAEALRGLIEQVTLSPGAKRGEVLATLHGEFGTILEWVGRMEAGQTKTPGPVGPGVMRSMVAGTCSHLDLLVNGRC